MTRTRAAAGKTLRVWQPRWSDLDPDAGYIFSSGGTEVRSRAPLWDECLHERPEQCVEVVSATPNSVVARRSSGAPFEIGLHDSDRLTALFDGFTGAYVDVSGLAHHVWAPLLRASFAALQTLRIVYAEPDFYRPHPNPTSRTEYDLSESFRGIEPLPGFAKLVGPEEEQDAIFVALLGFEGKRATHVALTLDPLPPVYAIIGIPGFRVEYPQVTYASNSEFLKETRAHGNIRIAAASCPFETFETLADIQRDSGGKYMYIAPIGTKPHAVGAVCYALRFPDSTELMYDHPVRKAGRTQGIGLVHFYTLKPSHVAN